MKIDILILANLFLFIILGCHEQPKNKDKTEKGDVIIGNGQMPNAIKDNSDNLHIVYGSGDSIMYSVSSDEGKTFSQPQVIALLPKLAASHTRGPQIAATKFGVTVTACNTAGNIYSYRNDGKGKWSQPVRVNDVDTIAKEGLMALSGDGESFFAVWLDLRGNKKNKIVGARSTDGGKTWQKNILIYASPDTTVCECCKPSVAVKGNNVYVMFRNWLDEKRDMYLIQSSDDGNTFGQAQKLGNGTWKLNGCPMDGGGISVSDGKYQTVWRREGKIYACEPGKPETEIGEGRGCTIESSNGKNVYAWTEKDEVVCFLPSGEKKYLGNGQLPVVEAMNNDQVICIWENEKQIHASIVNL